MPIRRPSQAANVTAAITTISSKVARVMLPFVSEPYHILDLRPLRGGADEQAAADWGSEKLTALRRKPGMPGRQ